MLQQLASRRVQSILTPSSGIFSLPHCIKISESPVAPAVNYGPQEAGTEPCSHLIIKHQICTTPINLSYSILDAQACGCGAILLVTCMDLQFLGLLSQSGNPPLSPFSALWHHPWSGPCHRGSAAACRQHSQRAQCTCRARAAFTTPLKAWSSLPSALRAVLHRS